MWNQLTYNDFVLIAAAVFDAPAAAVESRISRRTAEAALAAPFGGPDEIVLYPDPAEQAAICCCSIVRSRPLDCCNKRVAYECMREMLVRSGYTWPRLGEDPEEISATLDRFADGAIGEAEFVLWVRARVGLGEWLRYRGDRSRPR
jgi:prophage maintenance system killer protein